MVLTALLIVIALLAAIVAYLSRRIARVLSGLAADLEKIEAHVAQRRSAMAAEASAAAPPAAGPGDEPAPVELPVRRRGVRGRAVVLPNGRRRADYIRDRYYGDGADRSTIRKEINAMLEEAGADERVRYQVVYAATTSPTDPRGERGA